MERVIKLAIRNFLIYLLVFIMAITPGINDETISLFHDVVAYATSGGFDHSNPTSAAAGIISTPCYDNPPVLIYINNDKETVLKGTDGWTEFLNFWAGKHPNLDDIRPENSLIMVSNAEAYSRRMRLMNGNEPLYVAFYNPGSREMVERQAGNDPIRANRNGGWGAGNWVRANQQSGNTISKDSVQPIFYSQMRANYTSSTIKDGWRNLLNDGQAVQTACTIWANIILGVHNTKTGLTQEYYNRAFNPENLDLGNMDTWSSTQKEDYWWHYLDALVSLYAASQGSTFQDELSNAIDKYIAGEGLDVSPVSIALVQMTCLVMDSHMKNEWFIITPAIHFVEFACGVTASNVIDGTPWRSADHSAMLSTRWLDGGTATSSSTNSIIANVVNNSIIESKDFPRYESTVHDGKRGFSWGLTAICYNGIMTKSNPAQDGNDVYFNTGAVKTAYIRLLGLSDATGTNAWISGFTIWPMPTCKAVPPIGRLVAIPDNKYISTKTIPDNVTLTLYGGAKQEDLSFWSGVVDGAKAANATFTVTVRWSQKSDVIYGLGQGSFMMPVQTFVWSPDEFYRWITDASPITNMDITYGKQFMAGQEHLPIDYTADVTVQVSTGSTYTGVPTDDASWELETEGIKYTSTPQAYVELKNYGVDSDMVGNLSEDFEAMAGVPSTEQLYFAAGGSEFIVDITVNETADEIAYRTYDYYYTETQCEYYTGDQTPTYTVPSYSGILLTGSDYTLNPHTGDLTVSVTISGIIHNDATDVTKLHSATCVAKPNATDVSNRVSAYNSLKAWYDNVGAFVISKTAASDKKTRTGTIKSLCKGSLPAMPTGVPQTTNASVSCSKSDGPPPTPCGNEMATAKKGADVPWSVTASWTIPAHQLCGPCCRHILPEVHDTWTQTTQYDSMEINNVHVWRIDQAAIDGLEEIIDVDLVNADVVRGLPNIYYNIALKNIPTYKSKDNGPDNGLAKGGNMATRTAEAGRIVYSYERDQVDTVDVNLGTRTNKCDGLAHTETYNIIYAGGKGHNETDWDTHHGFIYTKSSESFDTSVSGNSKHGETGCKINPRTSKTWGMDGKNWVEEHTDDDDKKSTEYPVFKQKRDDTNQSTMVTDFLILQTSSGDQSVMYYQQSAPEAVKCDAIMGNIDASNATLADIESASATDGLINAVINKTNNGVTTTVGGAHINTVNGQAAGALSGGPISNRYWYNNPLSASGWDVYHIGLGSYNGKYWLPESKFNGTSGGAAVNTLFDSGSHGSKVMERPVRSNRLMIYAGELNIKLDNTNQSYVTGYSEVFWSNQLHWNNRAYTRINMLQNGQYKPYENIDPTDFNTTTKYATTETMFDRNPDGTWKGNGEGQTAFYFATGRNQKGNAGVTEQKTIRSKYQFGINDYKVDGGYVLEGVYSDSTVGGSEFEKCNDIIVHDPVSTQDIALVPLPDYRDQRTNERTGGAVDVVNKINENIKCPEDPGLCEFRTLHCTFFEDHVVFNTTFTPDASGMFVNTVTGNSLALAPGFTLDRNNSFGSGQYALNANGTRLSIPFSEMDVTYSTGTKIRVEADVIMTSTGKPQMLFSFNKYAIYLPASNELGLNENRCLNITTGTDAGWEKKINIPVADGKKHHIAVDFSFNKVTGTKVLIDGVESGYTIIKTSNDINSSLVGSTLNIGSWNVNDLYGANFWIDNLKVTRLAGTNKHTDECYTVYMTHKDGLNAHNHTANCIQGVEYDVDESFGYTGGVQQYKAVQEGDYLLEVWGASGGGDQNKNNPSHAGLGGYSKGTVHLKAGQTVYIYVGGQGKYADAIGKGGGYNGGGQGGPGGYGGGGMTHISTTQNPASTSVTSRTVETTAADITYEKTVSVGGKGTYDMIEFQAKAGGTIPTLKFYSSNMHMYYFTLRERDTGTQVAQTGNVHLKDADNIYMYNVKMEQGKWYVLSVSSNCSNFKGSCTARFTTSGGTTKTTVYDVHDSWNSNGTLIVAGGGGGSDDVGGVLKGDNDGSGGNGGGTNGENALVNGAASGGSGATQTSGYKQGTGQSVTVATDAGAAGGGWYGGKTPNHNNGGGGGGSGYIGKVTNGVTKTGENLGDGRARISKKGNVMGALMEGKLSEDEKKKYFGDAYPYITGLNDLTTLYTYANWYNSNNGFFNLAAENVVSNADGSFTIDSICGWEAGSNVDIELNALQSIEITYRKGERPKTDTGIAFVTKSGISREIWGTYSTNENGETVAKIVIPMDMRTDNATAIWYDLGGYMAGGTCTVKSIKILGYGTSKTETKIVTVSSADKHGVYTYKTNGFGNSKYDVEIVGASGGDGRLVNQTTIAKNSGGMGAVVRGTTQFAGNTNLMFTVGGKGGDQTSTAAETYGTYSKVAELRSAGKGTFTFKAGKQYKIVMYGAAGGGGRIGTGESHGGYGGMSTGMVKFDTDTKAYYYTGGKGSYAQYIGYGGGYNGGGNGGPGGYGGGGMTYLSLNDNGTATSRLEAIESPAGTNIYKNTQSNVQINTWYTMSTFTCQSHGQQSIRISCDNNHITYMRLLDQTDGNKEVWKSNSMHGDGSTLQNGGKGYGPGNTCYRDFTASLTEGHVYVLQLYSTCSAINGQSATTQCTTSGGYVNTYKTVMGDIASTKEFNYTGSAQSYTIPESGWYKLEAWGASGGGNANMVGQGGYTSGTVYLTKGTVIYIYVGQQGTYTNSGNNIAPATFNGGGNGGHVGLTLNGHQGGAGGGATDFRFVSGAWNNADGLKSRILVAGGGGGTGCGSNHNRGNGGGLVGATTFNQHSGTQWDYYGSSASGGSQTAGGKSVGAWSSKGASSGSFGKGADAAQCAAGGGGGYYGGGSEYTAGGAGGSSFVSGYTGCDTTYRSNQKFVEFKDVALIQGGNTGNGKAKISKVNQWSTDGIIMIAGGGGGADNADFANSVAGGSDDGSGGNGGGTVGGNALINGKDATTVNGSGAGGTQTTGFGQGIGESAITKTDTGGGGAGWCGGRTTENNNGGAGGGSGYINTDVVYSVGEVVAQTTQSNNTGDGIIEIYELISISEPKDSAGGFNGGGVGAREFNEEYPESAAGGGGMTDLRTFSTNNGEKEIYYGSDMVTDYGSSDNRATVSGTSLTIASNNINYNLYKGGNIARTAGQMYEVVWEGYNFSHANFTIDYGIYITDQNDSTYNQFHHMRGANLLGYSVTDTRITAIYQITETSRFTEFRLELTSGTITVDKKTITNMGSASDYLAVAGGGGGAGSHMNDEIARGENATVINGDGTLVVAAHNGLLQNGTQSDGYKKGLGQPGVNGDRQNNYGAIAGSGAGYFGGKVIGKNTTSYAVGGAGGSSYIDKSFETNADKVTGLLRTSNGDGSYKLDEYRMTLIIKGSNYNDNAYMDKLQQYYTLIPDKLPDGSDNPIWSNCTKTPNYHKCNENCAVAKVLTCSEPHHNNLHYDVSSRVCWEPCHDDENHRLQNKNIQLGDTSFTPGNFINIDYGFTIFFPNRGNFYEGEQYGVGSLLTAKGLGFRNIYQTDKPYRSGPYNGGTKYSDDYVGQKVGMSTSKWTRVKRIKFNLNVIYKGKLYLSGEWITLGDRGTYEGKIGGIGNKTSDGKYSETKWSNYNTELYNDLYADYYPFYAVLDNEEARASKYMVEVTALNCKNFEKSGNGQVNDNTQDIRNDERGKSYAAKHGGHNEGYFDVVGRIGNLLMEDTEDFRFSNLFKQTVTSESTKIAPKTYLVNNGLGTKDSKNTENGAETNKNYVITNESGQYAVVKGINVTNKFYKIVVSGKGLKAGRVAIVDANTGDEISSDLLSVIQESSQKVSYYVDLSNESITKADLKIISKSANVMGVYSIEWAELGSSPDKWLLEGIVREVDETKQNVYLSWVADIRGIKVSKDTHYLDTWGTLTWMNGNRMDLPLSPEKNNIDILKDEPLLTGYAALMDIQTIGSYWQNDTTQLQIIPKYVALNTDNGTMKKLDVYMEHEGAYVPLNYYNNVNKNGSNQAIVKQVYDNILNLDWVNTKDRRNVSALEDAKTQAVYENSLTSTVVDETGFEGDPEDADTVYRPLDVPGGHIYTLGNNQYMRLTGEARTFVGGTSTYGEFKNLGNRLSEVFWYRSAQRWHFLVGVPSSAVFVESGKPVTDDNINEIKEGPYVLACALNITAVGNVWALQYKHRYSGSTLANYDDYKHNIVTKNTEPGRSTPWTDTGKTDGAYIGKVTIPNSNGNDVTIDLNKFGHELDYDPIVLIFSASKDSSQDIEVVGTH